MRGIDIARACDISTSTLKHYEEWGLVPEIPRTDSGYRNYTDSHLAYFKCIVKMNIGYGMGLVKEIMPLIQQKKFLQALWKVNAAQASLHRERIQAEQVIHMLDTDDIGWIDQIRKRNEVYTIGEVAEIAGVRTSALRHWEKERLIDPKRDPESGYRLYTQAEVKRVLIIRTVSRAAWSLDIVREVLAGTDVENLQRTREMAIESLTYIDQSLIAGMKGISNLTQLIDSLAVPGDEWATENLGSYGYFR
ncbi:MerR family transcriptional regulator [Alkalibacterium thalassium]|uniref:DNA-binding transcriptional regulator, MerR family n=1 Tax=Alkalibacterium thalassium TaxID=426701 RepID=A0A1G8XBT1_9LACT|nr:MerR family transcriptional regulator [Alkalibacterium thalassium]SDJ88032.1 DNA-binding transcriptional regulator, MerR family [Alkalibacterium thalassium]